MKLFTLPVGMVQTNCYIAADENTGGCAVIDPGGDAVRILGLLKRENLAVKYIFLTHGHFDHILAVPEIKRITGAPVVIHKADTALLSDSRLTGIPVRVPVFEAVSADTTVSGGEDFSVGSLTFSWISTPGHTPGSCCIICGGSLFSGDTLFAGDCGRCDLPGGDYGQMLNSLKALAALPGDYNVYPGHGGATTLDRERKFNNYMREAVSLK